MVLPDDMIEVNQADDRPGDHKGIGLRGKHIPGEHGQDQEYEESDCNG